MRRSWGILLAVAAMGALLGVCTIVIGITDPVTLRLLSLEGGSELDPALQWYIQRVEQLSEDAITIDVVHGCCEREGAEAQLVAAVAAGTADLGWVGTRVFETLGSMGLRALSAPMLIDSYRLEQAVITSTFAKKALVQLEPLGVTGLALMPGALRKPLSTVRPMLSPADWAGMRVAAYRSDVSVETFRALGAVPVDVGFDEREQGLLTGSIQAAENTLAFHNGHRVQSLPYATANVSLWPRVSALIGNPGSLRGLSKGQIQVMSQAASDTADRTGELADLDAGFVAASCRAGARFGTASASQLDELRAALRPVYARLDEDAATRTMVREIRALGNTINPEPELPIPNGCSGAVSPKPKRGIADFE